MKTNYQVEAWRGLECVAWARVARADTVLRRVEHYAVDLGADRIYVRWTGDIHGLAADWTQGAGWRRVDDRALEAAIAKKEAG